MSTDRPKSLKTISPPQQTIALVVPSSTYRIEDIKRRFTHADLTIVSTHTITFNTPQAHRYLHHKYNTRDFPRLLNTIANQQCICVILERHNAVQRLQSVIRNSDSITQKAVITAPNADVAQKQIDCILRRQRVGQPSFGLVLMGPPASGKGTQCALLREAYGLVQVSTGDLLRSIIANPEQAIAEYRISHQLIDTMQAMIKNGELVSDDIVFQLTQARLLAADVTQNGFILDGFPRTEAQAVLLGDSGIHISHCIVINVPDTTIVSRVSGRRMDPVTGKIYHVINNPPPADIAHRCIQRSDDNDGVIAARLNTYHAQLSNITKHLTNVYTVYDKPKSANSNSNSMYDVFHSILGGIDSQLPPVSQVVRLSSSRTRERYRSSL